MPCSATGGLAAARDAHASKPQLINRDLAGWGSKSWVTAAHRRLARGDADWNEVGDRRADSWPGSRGARASIALGELTREDAFGRRRPCAS